MKLNNILISKPTRKNNKADISSRLVYMYFCKIPTKMNVREVVSKVLLTRPKTHFRISATCFVCPVFPSCLSCNVNAIPLTYNVGEKFFFSLPGSKN